MEIIGVVSYKPEDLTWDKALRLFSLRCRSLNLAAGTQALYTIRIDGWRNWLAAHGNPQPLSVKADAIRSFLEDTPRLTIGCSGIDVPPINWSV